MESPLTEMEKTQGREYQELSLGFQPQTYPTTLDVFVSDATNYLSNFLRFL